MSDDLVTRAKAQAQAALNGDGRDSRTLGAAMGLLIARIEADAAKIARLEGERDEYMRMMRLERVIADKNADKATTAEAKLAALVEACEALREGYGANYIDADTWEAVTAFADAAVTAAKGAK